METYQLVPHAAHPPLAVSGVRARVLSLDDHWLCLRWRVADPSRLIIPPFAGKHRADDLWRETCFEMFIKRVGADGYSEFNFSPSDRWAAYDFDRYRTGMRNRAMRRDPVCTMRPGGPFAFFDVAVPLGGLPALPLEYGLTAVICEQGGVVSYWASRHAGERPDFHDPTCLAGQLVAPASP